MGGVVVGVTVDGDIVEGSVDDVLVEDDVVVEVLNVDAAELVDEDNPW